MIAIICVDDKFGMMFNNRRQSRDAVVIQKIMEITKDHTLWMGSYSSALFPNTTKICVDDDFPAKAKTGEYCFVEDKELLPFAGEIEKIILFRWNRIYPSDKTLDIDLSGRTLIESSEFAGKSHAKITMEVFS